MQADAVVWDDPAVDWSRYDAAVIRSTWDYHLNPAAFASWLSRIESLGVSLWNPVPVIRANCDKSYLKTFEAAGTPVTPTVWIPRGKSAALDEILAANDWDDAVVKPVISAGAYRTSRARRGDPAGQEALDEALAHSGAMVQPFLPEISGEGEWSFVFLGGEFSHAVLKKPRRGDFRVQEGHGGTAARVEPPARLLARAEAVAALAPGPWLYLRVDGVRRDADLLLIEVEMTEPSLYFTLAPESGRRFAALIEKKITSRPSPRK